MTLENKIKIEELVCALEIIREFCDERSCKECPLCRTGEVCLISNSDENGPYDWNVPRVEVII